MCFLGIGCSTSTSNSSQTNYNDNSVTDQRTVANAEGAGATAIDQAAGANFAVDSHDISTVDSHNVQTTTINTQVVDAGLVNTAGNIATTALNSTAGVLTAASRDTAATTQAAIRAAGDAANAAAEAARRTASDAISAITSDAADSRALARVLGTDAINFASDVSTGFLASQADLNRLVGNLSSNNDKFLTDATDKILARSQSADQQNFEATLNLLKWVAVALAAAFVAPKLVKGAA